MMSDLNRNKWAGPSELLHVVLSGHLDLAGALKARLVCRTWHSIFSANVQQLCLTQPKTTTAAKALGRQAAAAFSSTSILRVNLHLSTPEAAVALLQPLRQLRSLQELRVSSDSCGCRCLPAALPLLPQLQVLDLAGCFHRSCDLLVIAQHMKQLQQLLLHCPKFVTLSGRVAGQGYSAWERVGGVVRYQSQQWLAAIATLTQLTALHIIQGPSARWPLPAGQLSRPCSLTALLSLSTDAGAPHDKVAWAGTGLEGEAEQQAQLQSQQWGVALACMQQLTRLDLVYVLLCDALLITIGSAAPQLRELSLDLGEKDFAATASAAGAAAVAHIRRIELVWTKSLECKHTAALLQLPNISKYRNRYPPAGAGQLSRWTAETCICTDC